MATTTTNPNVYLQQRAEGVQRLLDDLTRDIRSGDQAALRALFDAGADRAFVARFTVAADNLSADASRGGSTSSSSSASSADARGGALKLRDFAYRLAPTEEAEIQVPPEVAGRLDAAGSTDTWVAPVELHYALGGAALPGVDEPDVVVDTQLIVARYDSGEGDTWRLVGDQRLLSEPVPDPQLWELPGLAATDVLTGGGVSVVASYPGTAQTVTRVRGLLPGAVSAVTAFWGTEWPRRAVVVATAEPAEFGVAGSSTTDTQAAAAATTFGTVDRGVASGQRIVLTPSARDLASPVLGVVVRHELTHVATRTVTAADAPMWMTEGLAEYVGRKGTYVRLEDAAPDLAAAVRAGGPPRQLPTNEQFAVSGPESALAYQSAWSLAAFVADRYGEVRLKALYRGVAASGVVARQDVAISTALGVTRAQLVASWQRWLTEQVPG
ncbi:MULTISPECIES: hypothetical protein [unclassified Gordonia (in: high G+C Gram-positive bacteria)]